MKNDKGNKNRLSQRNAMWGKLRADAEEISSEYYGDEMPIECVNRFRMSLATAEEVNLMVQVMIVHSTAKHLIVFYLDDEHRLLAYTIMSDGPLKVASISQRELFQRAVETGASAIFLAHNHPEITGPPNSHNKEELEQWRAAGEFVGIPILGLVIATGYDSFILF